MTHRGSSNRLLVLHGGTGPDNVTDIAEHYPDTHHIFPTHPGWTGTPRPEWLASVRSLATVYLDLPNTRLDVAPAPAHAGVTVVGS